MSRVQQIATILVHYFSVCWGKSGARWEFDNQQEIEELARLIADEPKILARGNGTCICRFSPEAQEEATKRAGLFRSWLEEYEGGRAGLAQLDHRCPRHGQGAQPALWGRHKTVTLDISAKEWASLGVVYEEQADAKA